MFPTFRRFVYLWQKSRTPMNVCRKLQMMGFTGMDLAEVLFWSERLRAMGVRLRVFSQGQKGKLSG